MNTKSITRVALVATTSVAVSCTPYLNDTPTPAPVTTSTTTTVPTVNAGTVLPPVTLTPGVSAETRETTTTTYN